MLIGRVKGEVVASHKHPSHEGLKLLLVQPLELDGSEREGAPFLAIDSVGAGVDDRVLLTMDGWAAMTAVGRSRAPIDAGVVGIVDEVELAGSSG